MRLARIARFIQIGKDAPDAELDSGSILNRLKPTDLRKSGIHLMQLREDIQHNVLTLAEGNGLRKENQKRASKEGLSRPSLEWFESLHVIRVMTRGKEL